MTLHQSSGWEIEDTLLSKIVKIRSRVKIIFVAEISKIEVSALQRSAFNAYQNINSTYESSQFKK